jgi:hypothetical protein
MKESFKLWGYIALMMFLVIFVDFVLFEDFMMYSPYYVYMKEIFIFLFIFTIAVSVFVIGYFFKLRGHFNPTGIKDYLKLYWAILWRALVIVIPVVGIIAYVFKGSIESRILTIFVEILAGLPAIYWYLKKIKKSC